MGLVAFELLFEARARYLFTFTPIFVILATIGWWGGARKGYNFLRSSRSR